MVCFAMFWLNPGWKKGPFFWKSPAGSRLLEPLFPKSEIFLCEIQNLLVSKIGPRNTPGTPTKSQSPILKNDGLTHAGDFQKNGPFWKIFRAPKTDFWIDVQERHVWSSHAFLSTKYYPLCLFIDVTFYPIGSFASKNESCSYNLLIYDYSSRWSKVC